MTSSWTNADINFDGVDVDLARADEPLISLVTASSFIESASDLYTANLVRYFKDDREVADWLSSHWEPEELQHGRALRAYVARVWPEFDWDRTYDAFLTDYKTLISFEALRPTPALEMVARCVVETGTATLYRAIHTHAREPVLRDIVDRIQQDEVGHFKHFYRYFRKYQQTEQLGRLRVAHALLDRVAEVRRDDAACGLRHVFYGRYPREAGNCACVESWTRQIYAVIKRKYPFSMAAKMLITPLELRPWVKAWFGMSVAFAARLVMWGL